MDRTSQTNRIYRVVQGSLTEGDSLLLVDASNTNANLGSGVSGAIRVACGSGYQKYIHGELQKHYQGPMEPGQVLMTSAGQHPTAKWVAHVAVMDYRQGFTAASYPSLQRIKACYQNLWLAIENLTEHNNYSIAMVALGAGTGNVGLRNSVETACQTLTEHLAAHRDTRIGDLTFYGYELPEYLNTLAVVKSHFPIPDSEIPEFALEYIKD